VVRDQLQIQHVYLNGNRSFCHVLIYYSQHNRFLVIVVDCNQEVVRGHYLLDLDEEYGPAMTSTSALARSIGMR
jgi:hypothetical protein